MFGSEKRTAAMHGEGSGEPSELRVPRSDASKASAALFLAVAGIVLSVLLFYAQAKSIKETRDVLTARMDKVSEFNQAYVQEMQAVQKNVGAFRDKVAGIESQVSALRTLPAEIRRQALSREILELSQSMNFLGSQVEDQAQKERLLQAQDLLNQVQTDLGK